MHDSTIQRIELVRKLTQKYYEPGNQSKCYKAVWRNHIRPVMGINYRTYLSYINFPGTERTKTGTHQKESV